MSLREHIAEHFWSYTIVGGLLGWAAVKGEQYAKADQYAADAYDMNLHVWLCGRCHHVFDEKEEADECCLDEVDETAESVQAEMFIESDGLAVAVEGLDGTYLTDGEIKMGYTSASEAGFEPKELKTVMWVWDDIEGYGAYLATEQITFLSESFSAEEPNPYIKGKGEVGRVALNLYCEICFDARKKVKRIQCYPDSEEHLINICYECADYRYPDHIMIGTEADIVENRAESFHADPLLDYIKQRERERNAGTVKLQGMGRMEGTKAEDVRVGDVLLWNQGGSSQVLSITPKGKKSLLWKTRTADNREWERTVRKNRLVVVARPNSYTAKKYHAEYFNADSICPCECGGIIAEHDDRGYGVWECPQCGEDSDVDLGEICSVCWDKELLGESYYENSNSQECRECYGTGGLYDSHMGIDDRCRICRGTGYEKQDFASAVLAPEETTSPMRQALMTNYLMRKSMMEEELRYLQQEVLNGRMSRKQMAYRLMELEHRLRAEEDPKKRHKVKYLSGVKVKPRKLNGDLPPEVAMKRTLIGRESPETIEVEWDSNTQPIGSDPFNEVEWGAEQIERGRRHRVGGQIVEECVDIQGGKVDETSNYYRVRFRDPKEFTNFRVPAWAARAANSIGAKYYDVSGSKITMGQTAEGKWKIQSVMIPNNSFVNPKEAAIIANHIQDRIEREGKWAKKDCKDKERVLVVL